MLTTKILKLAKVKGRLRSSDLAEIGASRTLLAYLAKRGLLRRIHPYLEMALRF